MRSYGICLFKLTVFPGKPSSSHQPGKALSRAVLPSPATMELTRGWSASVQGAVWLYHLLSGPWEVVEERGKGAMLTLQLGVLPSWASICSSVKQDHKQLPGTGTSGEQNETRYIWKTLTKANRYKPQAVFSHLDQRKDNYLDTFGGETCFEYNYFYSYLEILYPVSRGLKMRKGDRYMLKTVAKSN